MARFYIPGALWIGFLLAACGYAPLYQKTAGDMERVVLGQVRMVKVERNVAQRRVAQLVDKRLRQTFHSGSGDYELNVAIEEKTSTLAVRRDATDQRLQLNLVARVTLRNVDTQKDEFTAQVVTSAAYNVETSPYGTESGRDRARSSAASTLGDEILQRVALYFGQKKSTESDKGGDKSHP